MIKSLHEIIVTYRIYQAGLCSNENYYWLIRKESLPNLGFSIWCLKIYEKNDFINIDMTKWISYTKLFLISVQCFMPF